MSAGTGRRVLVTGGAGMIGANLVFKLLEQECRPFLLLRPSTSRVRLERVSAEVKIIEGDLRNASAVQAAVTRAEPDIVFHLASTSFNPASLPAEEHFQVNVIGTLHLLEALRNSPNTRVVFTGSVAECGEGAMLKESVPLRPCTVLGASKASASILMQTYAKLYGIHTVSLRLFMPYGPWEHPRRLIPHTILSALAGRDVAINRGDQQRDLVHIDDVVQALILAATRQLPPGLVLNIGCGTGIQVKEVVRMILELMDNPVKVLVGALSTRPDEIMQMSADVTAAKKELGWGPTKPLEDGLRESIEWYKSNHELAERLANG